MTISTKLSTGVTVSTATKFYFNIGCACTVTGNVLVLRDELVTEIQQELDGGYVVTVEDYTLFLIEDYITDGFLSVWETEDIDLDWCEDYEIEAIPF